MAKTAARRRAYARRKARLLRDVVWADPSLPRQLGRLVSTHGRPCSCWLCSTGSRPVEPRFNPRATLRATMED